MYLLIDSSENTYQIAIIDNNQTIVKKWKRTFQKNQNLLFNINSSIKKNDKHFKDLKALFYYQGPGSFTGLRIGASIANTIAWNLNIPVFGLSTKIPENNNNFSKFAKKIDLIYKKSKSKKFKNVILPDYKYHKIILN